jgi:hypothetical protein
VKGDIKVTPQGVPITQKAIAAELKALRKGRGLRGDVADRIGPLLCELATGTAPQPGTEAAPALGSDAADVRRALADKLAKLAEQLPDDLGLAILAALALHDATRNMRTYERRREWLADQIHRVPRTAERRIDRAQEQLAQDIASELKAQRARPPAPDDADQWYIEKFTALLILDGDHPEAIERRTIRSRVDGLTELTIALDVPVAAGEPRLPLNLEAIEGGRLDITEDTARTRTRYVIRLPRPLNSGDTHEYATRVQVLDDDEQPMRDYYVLRPERRCDHFDLRVRFNRTRLPAWVRRVADEDVYSYYTYSDVPAPHERIAIDIYGEVTQTFDRLRTHYGYGLQWGWPAPGPEG